jgi:hypothetical protein
MTCGTPHLPLFGVVWSRATSIDTRISSPEWNNESFCCIVLAEAKKKPDHHAWRGESVPGCFTSIVLASTCAEETDHLDA